MRKILVLAIACISLFIFTACDGGIPDDVTRAVCSQGNTFEYVYKDDVVYEFYSDGVLQGEDMLDIVQTAVDEAGDTATYLQNTFLADACTYTYSSNINLDRSK